MAGFEFDCPFGWYLDRFEGFWILCCSSLSCSGFEDSEVSEFYAVVFGKLGDNGIEELLDYRFDYGLFCFSACRDLLGKLFFCNVWHI